MAPRVLLGYRLRFRDELDRLVLAVSIPEYLGDRYRSDGIRVIVAIASLLLFFYLAGQLVSGLVMFEKMLGLNEAWALKGNKSRFTFLRFASVFGITLGMLGLGGALARAVLGGRLLEEGSTPNEALPALFIELFPAWLAALIGVGILAAVMSTADGLVVSSSQIVANDIYRRTLAPRFHSHLSAKQLDDRVLVISRWATLGVMIVCVTMAWMLMDMNIAILVWTGIGGLMAAFAGPLVLGALWSGVTRAGAYTGLLVGLSAFLTLHTGVIDPAWFEDGFLHPVFSWLHGESPNPTSCAALAGLFAIGWTVVVSLATKPLPAAHVAALFRRVAATK